MSRPRRTCRDVRRPGARIAGDFRLPHHRGVPVTQQEYTAWWNQTVLDACRRSWNLPNMTLEELRARQIATAQRRFPQSEIQFDSEREADQQGISLPRYIRENR